METSKYDYVKSFQLVQDKLLLNTWIIVTIEGHNFHKFAEDNEFEKPNDLQALQLMNSCDVATLEAFPDIVFAYGQGKEYSFVLKKTSDFHQRRASKIQTTIASFFAATYIRKWKDFFPEKDLRSITPCFDGTTACCPSNLDLRNYLAWRQVDCHINNQYNTCFWKLVESGKTEKESHNLLKGTQSEHKNELLFKEFGINYNTLPEVLRKGSSVFREKIEETGDSVGGLKKKVLVDHCDIKKDKFWKEHPWILDE